jgi:signal transduction histidine kinase
VSAAENPNDPDNDGGRMTRALVVDDLRENLYLLEALLKGYGYTVQTAVNGAEGLALANKDLPDIIISDVLMPTMDGFTFCIQCKSDTRLKQIPFIFYTATYTDPKDEKFALSLGADAFFVKPIEPVELIEKINEVVSNHGKRSVEETGTTQPVNLKVYNEILIHKLETKMADLDITNKELLESESRYRNLNIELEKRIRERTAQLEAANQELKAFSYSVSHDLRAPLRAMEGFSQILLKEYAGQLDETGQGYLNKINSASQHMKQLIDDLLDLSRVTRAELNKTKVNLSGMAAKLSAALSETQPGRQIEWDIVPDVIVNGDERLLEVALGNLLNNAFKFTSRHPTAHIEFGVKKENEQTVYFVRDDGAGFDMAYASKLFGPFQRLHSAGLFEGTGIGLTIVQRIINRHGGHVWAEAVIDKGATFYFTLG